MNENQIQNWYERCPVSSRCTIYNAKDYECSSAYQLCQVYPIIKRLVNLCNVPIVHDLEKIVAPTDDGTAYREE